MRGMASKRLGRTQDPTILVLTSLSGGPKHGYAVIKDIEEMSGVTFGPGTLYGVLARLEEEGLVEPLPAEGHRRPYRLTASGATVLRERLETHMKVASIGFGRLGTLGA
jgi:DNA-binding PadR family transcriptional regulator